MKQNKLKWWLLILIISVAVAGIFWASNFIAYDRTSSDPVAKYEPSVLLSNLVRQEKAKNESIDSINLINSALQRRINETQSVLNKLKIENRSHKQVVDSLIKYQNETSDVDLKLLICDSLATRCQVLISSNIVKDSLFEEVVKDFECRVLLKDSIIGIQQEHYDSLKISYSKVIVRQEELLIENTAQQKTINRLKRKRGFVGIIVAASSLFVLHGIK
ncbi:hypothetical protein ACE38W_00950 [Chitinophaga sp. Hz27]|uniref:hypothetical protein n=1 Tax=Chitinophaga sp. Hz27 TaxID=3347169 RepID=UPI0035D746F3